MCRLYFESIRHSSIAIWFHNQEFFICTKSEMVKKEKPSNKSCFHQFFNNHLNLFLCTFLLVSHSLAVILKDNRRN